MASDTYRLEGTGSTATKALAELGKGRKDLVSKLREAKLDVPTPVQQYRVVLRPSEQQTVEGVVASEITAVSSDAFDDALAKARKKYGPALDATLFAATETYTLDAQQLKAVRSNRLPGAAHRAERYASGATSVRDLLRR